jgi:hypothetical protein
MRKKSRGDTQTHSEGDVLIRRLTKIKKHTQTGSNVFSKASFHFSKIRKVQIYKIISHSDPSNAIVLVRTLKNKRLN